MVAERLAKVRGRIEAAARRSGRPSSEVTLVAVSKARSVAEIATAYEAGQRDFGENRADELVKKSPLLPADIRWHFVGTLQSRKAGSVEPFTHLLHSMDRTSLARRWAGGSSSPPPCLLQINIGLEPQKHGVSPDDASDALHGFREFGIEPIGLMGIPPALGSPEEARPFFTRLAALREALADLNMNLTELSMGMTDDFEIAIEEGATVVRVGRAIFGSPSN